jgi:pyridoxal phosphate enzyme (YggS family)
MSQIAENIKKIDDELPQGVRLVAVSKFHPIEKLKEAYEAGQRIFGENHVQELVAKAPQMPDDVEWHFIGHLQSNKVKALIPYVKLIHSIDSLKLLQCVNKEAAKAGRTVDVLLQLHVAKEETKFGLSCEDCVELAKSGAIESMKNVRVCGVMGMATNTDDDGEVRKEFSEIRQVFDKLKTEHFASAEYFSEVSMGMSGDYHIAIEEGSTMVRIGTSVFGPREY